ncbi:MAG: hypothetical protein SGPRY_007624, partial [Prymnesium sp.]
MDTGCVHDISSLDLTDNMSRPLKEILLHPVCSNISLEVQARLIEHATRADITSNFDFVVLLLLAFSAWACIEGLAHLYLTKYSHLAISSHATRVEARQCIVSCVHALWSVVATVFCALHIEQPYGASTALRHISHRVLTPVGAVFFAYLLWDLSHIII